ncbi:2-succinyl-6-hydroxy-2,4-cyclohexadiene-1-carboxylate synthase [Alicyclobacillus sp.]|uniref:2-succinyl-6-hydroxy-2, 4-cyclohexadiene-1-carboxylate synthase n=1 Tax=Alicyclobacillus sp. TaxID=61169 RepID=UPI0025BE4C0F|nr:2-succinyl-6-hydroxy-2,4-cyclohexadiene-1-carboxylate synthase [Alicyclobacillus sp.]MCL6517597.1 2-succinyl-6-hydroxy-2,4-cyclohexadiene-1-carboxylate synthase [Alicyclobacillus sp.]
MAELRTVDGWTWAYEVDGRGWPLLMLHGFTGRHDSWWPVADRLAASYRIIRVDMPGHGESRFPADARERSMEEAVRSLLRLMDALGVERFHLLGYSMGGRTALSLAVHAPRRVTGLVLESASPGLEDPVARRDRQRQDEALADWVEAHGVAAFAKRWAEQPLFSSQLRLAEPVRRRVQAIRLGQTAEGLAASLRAMGTGAQTPVWDRLDAVVAPTLLVTGALDEKFCAIARRMQAKLPDAAWVCVPDAGHTVHLEQPEAYVEAVLGHLAACDERRARR